MRRLRRGGRGLCLTLTRSSHRNNQQPARERLLLVTPPNSYRIAAYLNAARRLGVDVLVASPGRHALITAACDGLQVDLNDPAALDRLLQAAAKQPFAGVIATDDAAVELAGAVAQALSLPHNPPAAAKLSRRKDLARARLATAGVSVPAHRLVQLDRPLAPQLRDLSYPVVVKPVSLSASRGVIRADDETDCLNAIARVQALLAKEPQLPADERDRILIENFVPGAEIAVEAILRHGRLDVLAIFDKPDPMDGPYFEETYYLTPSRHAAPLLACAIDTVAAACAAYGLREGPVHAELRLRAGIAWIMEVASRTIGGDCARLLEFGTGSDLESLVISYAMNRPAPIRPLAGGAGVLMLPVPAAGILRRVEGLLDAGRTRWIEDVSISVREGYELVPLPEGGSYLGFVFAHAPDAAQAEAALREAFRKLKIVVAPLFRLGA